MYKGIGKAILKGFGKKKGYLLCQKIDKELKNSLKMKKHYQCFRFWYHKS